MSELKVKQLEPKAEHVRDSLYGVSDIIVNGGRPFSYRHLGRGKDEESAWKDALRRLKLRFLVC